jgi:nicotinate-nucleotide pyrophosphorylase (carboxylating)
MTLSSALSDQIRGAGLDPADIEAVIERSLAEDLAGGVDVTSVATVPATQQSILKLVARESGVVAGVVAACAAFEVVGQGRIAVSANVVDGASVDAGSCVVTATGPTVDLLTAERTALNLLCHLSGIATLTARWVSAVAGTDAAIRDTRKTTPGLRSLEKFAVRCGGGVNHRMSLSDAALVKDNHVLAAGSVEAAFSAVRDMWPDLDVEVEVDSLEQLDEVLAAGADLVLLDNFTVAQTREAVRATAGRARLESSGGLSLSVARDYAETGVDFLAVGALTHSAPVLDVGGDLEQVREA